MKIVWLIANIFGYELFNEAIRKIMRFPFVFTLSKKAKTRMYDFPEDTRKKLELICHFHHNELIEIEDINKEIKRLKEIAPDYIIVAGWRQIISQEILNIPKFGVIGFHPTPLPLGRGSAPIINQILLGWEESASTMFFYNNKVDSGDIIDRVFYEIEKIDYAQDIYEKYIIASVRLLDLYLPLLENGKLTRYEQDDSKATYFPKRTLEDNEIKITDDLETIDRKVRAFSKPYLGAYIKKGNRKLIIERCRIEES